MNIVSEIFRRLFGETSVIALGFIKIYFSVDFLSIN